MDSEVSSLHYFDFLLTSRVQNSYKEKTSGGFKVNSIERIKMILSEVLKSIRIDDLIIMIWNIRFISQGLNQNKCEL